MFQCKLCGATGDKAHTRNYCPTLTVEDKLDRPLPEQLANTRRKANGRRFGVHGPQQDGREFSGVQEPRTNL